MYFDEIETVEQLKEQYKELAKVMHPDMGGCEEDFKAMKEEYDARMEYLTDVPSWLSDEYVQLGRALCGLARMKKPAQYEKASVAVDAISSLLGLSSNRNARNIKTFVDRLNLKGAAQ